MQRLVVTGLICMCSFTCSMRLEKITESSDVHFSEIVAYAVAHQTDEQSKPNDSILYYGFNFERLTENSESQDTVKVYKNAEDQIVSILRISGMEDNNFKFKVIYNARWNCHFMYVEQWLDIDPGWLPVEGFFCIWTNKCYFINFSKDRVIMQLDQDAKVIKTLRFQLDKLKYRTEVNYFNNSHICSESFYETDRKFVIDQKTLFIDILKEFDIPGYVLKRNRKIGWVREMDYLPLWSYAGEHEFDIQATEPFDCNE